MEELKDLRQCLVNVFWFLMGLAICSVATCLDERTDGRKLISTDTLTIHDTIRHDSLVPVRSEVVRIKRIMLPVSDTANAQATTEAGAIRPDTGPVSRCVTATLPITQHTYTDDSTYTAWVSGYDACLDSIEVYRRQQVITNNFSVTSRKRWNVALQGGLYATPKGLQPGIGIGLSYSLQPP